MKCCKQRWPAEQRRGATGTQRREVTPHRFPLGTEMRAHKHMHVHILIFLYYARMIHFVSKESNIQRKKNERKRKKKRKTIAQGVK